MVKIVPFHNTPKIIWLDTNIINDITDAITNKRIDADIKSRSLLLYFKLQKLVNEGADFIDKPCTRNTLSYTYSYIDSSTGEKITVGPKSEAKLQNECNKNGQEVQKKYQYDQDTTVIFTCNQVQVFFSKGGTSLLEGYIKTIYTWAASIVGLIAVAVIVVSGIQISVSGGDSGALTSAKERIVRSLLGIAILFLSGLILYTVNPNFFVTTTSNQEQTTTDTTQPTSTNTPTP